MEVKTQLKITNKTSIKFAVLYDKYIKTYQSKMWQ